MFADKYGSEFKKCGSIYMPDGMVYSCHLSKSAKLIFGLKDLAKSIMFMQTVLCFLNTLATQHSMLQSMTHMVWKYLTKCRQSFF